ncbi:MAG: BrnA antitoxin family protein [Candidatus Methylopumilus sp.]|jgi:uncharacterized protein (DUF4415 family)|nr:BrnA antitoxin family protein [Candidatus Methylopumilus sp.]
MKKKLIRPSDAEDQAITLAAMSDVDATPLTDSEWAEIKPQLKRGPGRPIGSNKSQVTLRLDSEVLQALKSTGRGWQTRANEVLRSWVNQHSR